MPACLRPGGLGARTYGIPPPPFPASGASAPTQSKDPKLTICIYIYIYIHTYMIILSETRIPTYCSRLRLPPPSCLRSSPPASRWVQLGDCKERAPRSYRHPLTPLSPPRSSGGARRRRPSPARRPAYLTGGLAASRFVRVILAQGPCKSSLHRSNFNG